MTRSFTILLRSTRIVENIEKDAKMFNIRSGARGKEHEEIVYNTSSLLRVNSASKSG